MFTPVETLPIQAEAVLFDGKNGREIVQYIKDHSAVGEVTPASNGGRYIKLNYEPGLSVVIRSGDYVIKYHDSLGSEYFAKCTAEDFKNQFKVKKARAKKA